MIDRPPPPGPPLSDAQRKLLERGFETRVAYFKDLETRYEADLAVIGREMERLVATGLDHRCYALQELDKWTLLFSSAARGVEVSAAMAGLDAADADAVTEQTIARVIAFAEKIGRQVEEADRKEREDRRAGAIEVARAQAKGLALLGEQLRKIRARRR